MEFWGIESDSEEEGLVENKFYRSPEEILKRKREAIQQFIPYPMETEDDQVSSGDEWNGVDSFQNLNLSEKSNLESGGGDEEVTAAVKKKRKYTKQGEKRRPTKKDHVLYDGFDDPTSNEADEFYKNFSAELKEKTEEYHAEESKLAKDNGYTYISENKYSKGLKSLLQYDNEEEVESKCNCLGNLSRCYPITQGGHTCESVASKLECTRSTCDFEGHYCNNRRLQNPGIFPKRQIFDAGQKQKGYKVMEDVSAGIFINEYMGNIIGPRDEMVSAFAKGVFKNNGYLMLVDRDQIHNRSYFYIDSKKIGNSSRFVNHSCDPNCFVETWVCDVQARVAIVALKDLKSGEEVTIDYGDMYGLTVCYCGTPKCRYNKEVQVEPIKSIPKSDVEKMTENFVEMGAVSSELGKTTHKISIEGTSIESELKEPEKLEYISETPPPPPPLSEKMSDSTSKSKPKKEENTVTLESDDEEDDKKVVKKQKTTDSSDSSSKASAFFTPGEKKKTKEMKGVPIKFIDFFKNLDEDTKFIFIIGAGISVASGIQPFRGEHGRYSDKNEGALAKARVTLKYVHGTEGGEAKGDLAANHLRKMAEMREISKKAKPSRFHMWMKKLHDQGRLRRIYSQNIDGLEVSAGFIPYETDKKSPLIQLHGSLESLKCRNSTEECGYTCEFSNHYVTKMNLGERSEHVFGKTDKQVLPHVLVPCPRCSSTSEFQKLEKIFKTAAQKRDQKKKHYLFPAIKLYDEVDREDDPKMIHLVQSIKADKKENDKIIYVFAGTSFSTTDVNMIAEDFKKNKSALTIFIDPSTSVKPPDCHYWFLMGTDDFVQTIEGE